MESYILITVRQQFREALLQEFPKLKKNLAYWKMLQYIIFSNFRDEETNQIVIPATLVAEIEGKNYNKDYKAIDFLCNFSKDIVHLDYTSYCSHMGKARMIQKIGFSEKVLEMIKEEKGIFDEDRVYFVDGRKYRKSIEKEYRCHIQSEALSIMENMGCQESFELLSYLNNLPSNRFSIIKQHLEEAKLIAQNAKDVERQLNILKNIESQAQPFYQSSEKSVRIFSLNDSILSLQRDVRQCMTQDWVTADLRSAQLAIIAKLWDVPYLIHFLKSKKSIWVELAEWMGLDYITAEDKEATKNVLKKLLYSFIFGAGKPKLKELLGQSFPSGAAALELFKSHYIIESLFDARDKQIEKIQREKGGTDAFGKFYDIEYFHVAGKWNIYDSSRSIMALQAQSYELKLLYPVLKLATDNTFVHSFTIAMWLHDGFCYQVHNKNEGKVWEERIKAVVAEQAAALGICTELEIS